VTPQAINPTLFAALAIEEAKVVAGFIQVLRQEQDALVQGDSEIAARSKNSAPFSSTVTVLNFPS